MPLRGGPEAGRTCQAGAGRLEGRPRELRLERRLGLRVPGWDLGAPGACPQAAVWVFDLRTSWHLEKLLVLGVGAQPVCHVLASLGLRFCTCGGSFCCYPRGGNQASERKVIPPGSRSWELAGLGFSGFQPRPVRRQEPSCRGLME